MSLFLRRARLLRPPLRPLSTLAPRHARFDTEGRAEGFGRRVASSNNNPPPPPNSQASPQPASDEQPPDNKVSNALEQAAQDGTNSLLAPVHIPNDPETVLPTDHPSTNILANSSIVIQRQLEMMNVIVGFEQANKYVIMDGQGNHIGYLAEQDHGFGQAMARQAFRTHRSFTTHVFDRHENEVLRFHRPFSWISSSIRVYDAHTPSDMYAPSAALAGTSAGSISNQSSAQVSSRPLSDMRVIGEAQQRWAPLRRKYSLFLSRDLSKESPDPSRPQLTSGDLPLSKSTEVTVAEPGSEQLGMRQFAFVNEPFLSWDFSLKSEDDRLVGSVNRNFAGFAREIFTDTGVYVLRMDAAGLSQEPRHMISHTGEQELSHPVGMTLDQRAVMLATAVSIDFDYFSRHSGSGGGFMPLWFPWWGGGAAGEAGAAGTAGAAGAEGAVVTAEGAGAAVGEAGQAARGVGIGEGIAGAGTMAGYEAMQRGREASQPVDDQSPQAQDWPPPPEQDPWGAQQDSWNQPPQQGQNQGFWGGMDEQQQPPGGGEEGEGGGFSLFDFFDDE